MAGPAASNPLDICCGGGHLHRECPEKVNTESTLSCWNCTLVEREKPHSIYITRMQPCERRTAKKSTRSSQEIFWENVLF
jgi:hypothetical protein